MPINKKTNKTGSYFENGTTGHKYRFNSHSIKSIGEAYRKARKQQKAIFYSGYKVKKR